VEHPLAAPDALVRPWRTAAYIAATIAVVELLVLMVIGGGALVGAVSDRVKLAAVEKANAPVERTAAPPAARKPAAAPAAKRPRTRTVVLVLNGNGRTGAAAAAASRVRGENYRIGSVGNAPRSDYARSIVMYKPGFAGEGRRLARDLRVKLVGPLDGMRARELGRAHLVYIVGA
jgi:hypothetical protein